MTRRLFIMLGLFCLFRVVQAQENTIDLRLQLPHESDLFTENVEIVERFQIIRAFDDTRQIYVYDIDTKTWIQYDYPPAVHNLMDGILIDEHKMVMYNLSLDEDYFITLDLLTGEYSEPETNCGNFDRTTILSIALNQDSSDSDRWRFHKGDLCNSSTLETYPVPEDIIEAHIDALKVHPFCGFKRGIPVRFSPDNGYFVFGTCLESDHLLYRYDLDTSTIELIYSITGAEQLTMRGWADNETLIFTTGFYLDFLYEEYFTEPPGIKLHRVNTQTAETDWIAFGSDNSVPAKDLNRGEGREERVFLLNVNDNLITLQNYEFATGNLLTTFELNCDDLQFSCDRNTTFGGFDPVQDYFIIKSDTYTQQTQHHIFEFNSHNLVHTISNRAGYRESWVDTGQYFWFEQASDSLLPRKILHIVTLDGERVVSDTLHEADAYSSDGSLLAIVRETDGVWRVIVESVETGDEIVVMELPSDSPIFEYTAMEIRLYFRDNLLEISLQDRYRIIAGWLINPIPVQE